jgi:hypothetical protein
MGGDTTVFGKSKEQENQYVIAVKDLADTQKALETETISLPYEKSLYLNLIATSIKKVDNQKKLSKFIKAENKIKGEVRYYWEGLIAEGYTLMDVHYDKKNPPMEKLCDTAKFKLICRV